MPKRKKNNCATRTQIAAALILLVAAFAFFFVGLEDKNILKVGKPIIFDGNERLPAGLNPEE